MRREVWLGLAAAGVLMVLPLSWLSLILLLILPGLAVFLLLKEKVRLAELIGVSGTLSLLIFPLALVLTSPLSVRFAGVLLGLIVVAIGLYGFWKRKEISVDTTDWQVQVVAALIFLVVLAITLKTFVIDDRGLTIATTHASDLNWHLSIAQRFAAEPQLPPQEPYLPGYQIVYNWFMQITFGGLSLLTGVDLFAILKVLIPLVAALTFLDAYLLALTIFKDDLKASLLAGFVYVASSGLSWLYLLYLTYAGQPIDVFKVLIYDWSGIMQLKYDSVSLYFFLPQPQTFGLMAAIFGLYLYLQTIGKKSLSFAVVTGLALASLVVYHLITAFPVLVSLGLFFLYLLFRERKQILENRDWRLVAVAALPLVMSALAGIVELVLMGSGGTSQVSLGHNKDVYPTILFTLGLLLPFALWGMYLAKDDLGARLLILFAALNFLFINVLEMNLTQNTYRFIVYMALPVSLFAGYALSKWLFSPAKWKILVATLVILAMVPSTLCIIMFYNDSAYTHATPADVKALEWVKASTPADAVFLEEPSHFVRLPVMTGREDVFAGEIYNIQYHNVDKQGEIEGILRLTDPDTLYSDLVAHHIDYVFVGSKESGYPFVDALKASPKLTEVYNRDGVKIYQVNRS